MRCPYCGYDDTKVIDTRSHDDNRIIKRRRLCEKCGKRFNTYEKVDTIPVTVVKRNGTREIFDKNKLLNGIIKSCNKRPVTISQMEGIADEIENIISSGHSREVESRELGNMVMERLKDIDEVAYVRFASVYRQFKDINTFMDELAKLMEEKSGEKKEKE
ncbi:MAG: transcriptional repressor NrdR [Firmicutes bacterium]|nr:transcriptional repressor NrdR [Bacillota bacterium]MBR0104569.1 transcriptional repressor NrdR [Bacillota bacterium]MBR2593823.1 transcriptional repressor NrdR [Bacillota bacterium]